MSFIELKSIESAFCFVVVDDDDDDDDDEKECLEGKIRTSRSRYV